MMMKEGDFLWFLDYLLKNNLLKPQSHKMVEEFKTALEENDLEKAGKIFMELHDEGGIE